MIRQPVGRSVELHDTGPCTELYKTQSVFKVGIQPARAWNEAQSRGWSEPFLDMVGTMELRGGGAPSGGGGG